MSGLFIIAVFVALAIVMIVISHHQQKRRREAMFLLATRLGLQFDPSPGDVHSRYEGFSPFGVGSSRRSSNQLSGRIGEIDFECFDYKYTTGSGKNKNTHRYGIVAANVRLLLPRLTIRPEGLFDKVVALAGWDDINFESEEFSRRYHVKCEDRKAAYDLIHPKMIEFFLASPARNWQFGGTRILLIQRGSLAPEAIEESIRLIAGFVQLIPGYVRQDLGV